MTKKVLPRCSRRITLSSCISLVRILFSHLNQWLAIIILYAGAVHWNQVKRYSLFCYMTVPYHFYFTHVFLYQLIKDIFKQHWHDLFIETLTRLTFSSVFSFNLFILHAINTATENKWEILRAGDNDNSQSCSILHNYSLNEISGCCKGSTYNLLSTQVCCSEYCFFVTFHTLMVPSFPLVAKSPFLLHQTHVMTYKYQNNRDKTGIYNLGMFAH